MNELLAQIVPAARNSNDDRGWMNILVLVLLAVFYGLGSILKAKSKKVEQQGEEQLPRKPARKPPGVARGLEKRFVQRPGRATGPAQRRKVMRPQPVVPRFAAEVEEAIRLPTLEPLEVSKLSPLGLPEEAGEVVIEEPLLDYADADELTRAILHYEILGRPLSLRGPGEQIIGL